MPYVQRDTGGNVIGVYARLQPGYATELLADNDPAVIAFLTPAAASNLPPIQVADKNKALDDLSKAATVATTLPQLQSVVSQIFPLLKGQ